MRSRLVLALCLGPLCAAAQPRYAVTVLAGVLTRNEVGDFAEPWRLDVVDSQLLGAALSARVAEPAPGLSLELEGQLLRHVGLQDNWELNAPIVTARWGRFPWDPVVDTSAAFGLGLSFTSEAPAFETEAFGEPDSPLAYWFIELDAGLPAERWRLAARLHHRSTAFGTFGEDGGSNALVFGLRRLL